MELWGRTLRSGRREFGSNRNPGKSVVADCREIVARYESPDRKSCLESYLRMLLTRRDTSFSIILPEACDWLSVSCEGTLPFDDAMYAPQLALAYAR